MNQRLRIGALGCGVITQRIMPGLRHILEDNSAVLAAGCDVNPDSIAAVAAGTPAKTIEEYSALEDMLARAQLDGVLIATPIALHPQHVAKSLAAGCHVYTHKTLAPSRAECLKLAEAAHGSGRCLAASPGQMLLPAYARAREIIESGELGELVSVDACAEAAAHRYEPERADEQVSATGKFSWEWYHDRSRGGGPLDDMFVYPLAFLTELLGPPTAAAVKERLTVAQIEWRGRTVAADAPDAYAGLLMFNAVPATIRSSFSANTSRVPWGFVTIRGTQASLEIEKRNDLEYRLHVTPNDGSPRVEALDVFNSAEADRLGNKECHVLTDIREFLQAVQARRDTRGATASNAARVAEALALIKASAARNGAWIYRGDNES